MAGLPAARLCAGAQAEGRALSPAEPAARAWSNWRISGKELIDRFGGPLPAPAENSAGRGRAPDSGGPLADLAKIHVEDEYAVLTYRNRRLIEGLARRLPKLVRVVDKQTAYVPLGEKRPGGQLSRRVLKEVFDGEHEASESDNASGRHR